MRVDVTIAPQGTDEWLVTLAWPGAAAPVERTLVRTAERPWLAPAGEQLPDPIVAATARILDIGEPDAGDGELLGRFLFDALLRGSWEDIDGAEDAAKGVTELALRADGDAAELHGLPWDLLHDDDAFLTIGRDPPVAVTHVIAEQTAPRQLQAPPRVLFAIGSSLDDEAIRPGAEFIGLLRRLEADGAAINSRVLEAADLTTLQRVAGRFEPDVVHVIAHGADPEAGKAAILVPDGPGSDTPREATAEQLLGALRHKGGLPTIVVLAACSTATAVGGRQATSFAARLVAGGVPIVVAMAGNVADDACRFFTRRFGQVLHDSCPLVAALAQGRRAAFFEGPPADTSIDWALPTLFLSAAVDHEHRPLVKSAGLDLSQLTRDLTLHAEPVFCGRREFFDAYDELMQGTGLRVLVVETADREGLGRRRLLKELGATALRDGHAPLLLIPPETSAPRSLRAFGAALLERLRDVRARLLLPEDSESVIFEVLGGGNLDLPENAELRSVKVAGFLAQQQRDGAAIEPVELRTAIGIDLARLAKALRTSELPTATEASRPLVLLGGVEYWGDALVPLLNDVIHADGLGRQGEPVPVVVTCRASGMTNGLLTPLREQATGLEPWIRVMPLTPFTEQEDVIAYQWVLLNPRRKLRVRYADEAYVVRKPDMPWHKSLRDITKALPGAMDGHAFYAMADTLANFEAFERTGDDEKRLRLYLEQHE